LTRSTPPSAFPPVASTPHRGESSNLTNVVMKPTFGIMKTISAAAANRQFSSVLREVAKGEVFTVLSRGRTVASIAPCAGGDGERKAAKTSLVARLRSESVTGTRSWTRDELYDA